MASKDLTNQLKDLTLEGTYYHSTGQSRGAALTERFHCEITGIPYATKEYYVLRCKFSLLVNFSYSFSRN